MALNRVDGPDDLYVGGLWALRRSDSLAELRVSHVLSVVGFSTADLRNFRDEPWAQYAGSDGPQHLVIDVDDVEDANLLIEMPRAVAFIDAGLRSGGAVFVHCAAGKSRSVSAVVAYLLWRRPSLFDPNVVGSTDGGQGDRPRGETADEAVRNAVAHVQRTRPMAEPNDGFLAQLALYWTMGCPVDADELERHPVYQRWAYQREVEESLAVGQAPTRLRFEDEQQQPPSSASADKPTEDIRCKKCRRSLATGRFISPHHPPGGDAGAAAAAKCQHIFVEPLGWMRGELEKGELNGRLVCPNARCGAAVGRYDWKGFKCSCAAWVTPAFSLQRARVDHVALPAGARAQDAQASLGIRLPPGARNGNL